MAVAIVDGVMTSTKRFRGNANGGEKPPEAVRQAPEHRADAVERLFDRGVLVGGDVLLAQRATGGDLVVLALIAAAPSAALAEVERHALARVAELVRERATLAADTHLA